MKQVVKSSQRSFHWWYFKYFVSFLFIALVFASALFYTDHQERNSLTPTKILGVTTVSFDVTPGTLQLNSPASTTLSNVTYTFIAQNSTGNLGTTTVTDARGTGAGWTLSMSSSNYSCCSGGNTISVTNLSVVPGSVTVVAGPNNVTAGSSHTFTSTSDQTTLMSAGSTQGMGIYSVNPALTLSVPAQSMVGTYTGTITTTLI